MLCGFVLSAMERSTIMSDKIGRKIGYKNGDVTVFKYPILDRKRGTLV